MIVFFYMLLGFSLGVLYEPVGSFSYDYLACTAANHAYFSCVNSKQKNCAAAGNCPKSFGIETYICSDEICMNPYQIGPQLPNSVTVTMKEFNKIMLINK